MTITDIRSAGFRLRLRLPDTVIVTPSERLTAEQVAAIQADKPAVVAALIAEKDEADSLFDRASQLVACAWNEYAERGGLESLRQAVEQLCKVVPGPSAAKVPGFRFDRF